MHVVVPFAAADPKTRLESLLSPAERSRLARAMLADVVETVVETGHEVVIVSTTPLETTTLDLEGHVLESVSVDVDERALSDAVNARLPGGDEREQDAAAQNGEIDGVAVVMADLALATTDALERLFGADGDVVVAPGRGGGTNALVVRHPAFRVDYHGASYLDHCEEASNGGATLETVDSFRLGTDIDEPEDLVEVLVHGSASNRTRSCLRRLGFELERSSGRVGIARATPSSTE
ncbi:2-phospho-L-lactate guanylyltransferase [Natronorubrum sediminis]|uniref:2-phospho-L-lactate guanylyltransferase n=1 Tax=Natronorubrum sediminis TaxID=640943 RepID=A0A1H6G217_9EURY|nr:2-phospho-L-lactate guanylyltransferase [Natronorubrum sediminis]SEH16508.1 2-phospho-L-lactate guanylyltransferase [Natronorubrum sediminis]